jgi:type VII secretion protein EccB
VSTKRDLVEAHAFSRRRLVTAFVSGAPGGREVEPVRPGRTIVGGIALAVLLLAGAAIAGHFKPTTPDNWLEPGMFVSKENGQGYVIVEKGRPLQPVVNATSAKLIFGEDLDPQTVVQAAIDKEEIGDRIGIFGAPESLPAESLLVGSGWTACTNSDAGVQLRIDGRPGVSETGDGAVVVRADGQTYVVAQGRTGAHRLLLPKAPGEQADVLNALRIGSPATVETTSEWVNLFPEGPALGAGSFGVAGGGTVSYGGQEFRVGELVSYQGNTYLVGKSAPMALDPFSEAVYRALTRDRRAPTPVSSVGLRTDAAPAGWPSVLPQPIPDEACAVLHAQEGEAAVVSLGSSPEPEASAAGLSRETDTSVAPSLGANDKTAGHGTASGVTPWLVDAQGKRYRLGGPQGTTAAALGYGSYPVPTIPESWVEPIRRCGPELSRTAALGRPDDVKVSETCPG